MNTETAEVFARAVLAELDPRDLPPVRIIVADRPTLADEALGVEDEARALCIPIRRSWWGKLTRRPSHLVVLYAGALVTESDVRVALLHELAHAQGLDEEAVDRLGLQED